MRPLSAEETIAQTKSHALRGVGALRRLIPHQYADSPCLQTIGEPGSPNRKVRPGQRHCRGRYHDGRENRAACAGSAQLAVARDVAFRDRLPRWSVIPIAARRADDDQRRISARSRSMTRTRFWSAPTRSSNDTLAADPEVSPSACSDVAHLDQSIAGNE